MLIDKEQVDEVPQPAQIHHPWTFVKLTSSSHCIQCRAILSGGYIIIPIPNFKTWSDMIIVSKL